MSNPRESVELSTDPALAFSDKKSVESMGPWEMLADQQRTNMETEQMNANQRLFDQYVAIEDGAKRQQLALDQQRAIAGAVMMESAFRNGGMSDRSLGPAFSKAFGQPVFGGQIVDLGEGLGRGFVLYGAAKDAQGNASVAPLAFMDGTQMMKTLQNAKLGDRTLNLQKAIFGDLSSRYTADQLGKMGVRNPSAPISTGGAVISGAGMRGLRGLPRTPSRIETFAADGKGGFSRSAYDRKTGEDWIVDYGTRDPNYQGKWKVLESGPHGKRYENDKTGEVVHVPVGASIDDVIAARTRKLASGLTFDERRQLQQEAEAAKNERAKLAQQSRKETEEERTMRRREERVSAWDNARYSAIEKRLDRMRGAKVKGFGGSEIPQYTPEQIAEEEKRLYDQMDADRAKAFPELYETRARTEQIGKTGNSPRQAPPSSGDNSNQGAREEIREDSNGVKWKIIRDKNGKAVGKQRVK